MRWALLHEPTSEDNDDGTWKPNFLTRSGSRWVDKTLEYVKDAKQTPHLKEAMLGMLEAITKDALKNRPDHKAPPPQQRAQNKNRAAHPHDARAPQEPNNTAPPSNSKGHQEKQTTSNPDGQRLPTVDEVENAAPTRAQGESTSPANTGEEDGRA